VKRDAHSAWQLDDYVRPMTTIVTSGRWTMPATKGRGDQSLLASHELDVLDRLWTPDHLRGIRAHVSIPP